MGEAKHRADLRRACREKDAADHPPLYGPQVPRLRVLNEPISQTLYDQIERRRPKTVPRGVFLEALLAAGCELLDQTAPELLVMPPGIEDAARRLQEIKRGTR